jgi:hypothetical protein
MEKASGGESTIRKRYRARCNSESIVIYIHANDHNPLHFHVYYAEHEILIGIAPLEIYARRLLRAQLAKVRDWAAEDQACLALNWVEYQS